MKTWNEIISQEMKKPYYQALERNIAEKRQVSTVYPCESDVFRALELTPLNEVKLVILGQDPYHGPHQAHGLSFSIEDNKAKFPPSLRNIFQELQSDVGVERTEANLTDWAQQGVLLLNTVLTVEAGKAGSHQKLGWEQLTKTLFDELTKLDQPIVFILWGAHAQKFAKVITNKNHLILEAPHPSPLSAYRGFFGSRPFSQANAFLKNHGIEEINWGKML